MKILTNCRFIVPAVAGLVALGATAMAWGAECTQGPDGTANPILFAKGKQSCDTINGYSGCFVTKGGGLNGASCDIKDSDGNVITTVTSIIGADDSLSWSSTGPAEVFAVALNGIQSGNACVYFYAGGEGTSQSGIGYDTSDDGSGSFTNVQDAYFCTDLNAEVVTTEPDLQPCVIDPSNPNNPINLIDGVDCGSFSDGTIVEVWTPIYGDPDANGERQVTGQEMQQCICNDGGTSGGVFPCNLEGTDDGDPGTSEFCFTKPNGDVEVSLTVEFFPDAKRCKTSGGTRSCDCIDNPFTTCNECTGGC